MVNLKALEDQLEEIGIKFKFWGRSELKELSRILVEGEKIHHCVNGQYEGGFALLAATEARILLIDRKPMFLTIEAIPYDKISQVFFNHRLLNATAHIFSMTNDLRFTSWNHAGLREIVNYAQARMTQAKFDHTEQLERIERQTAPALTQPVTDMTPAVNVYSYKSSMLSPDALQVASNGLKTDLYTAVRLPLRRRHFNT